MRYSLPQKIIYCLLTLFLSGTVIHPESVSGKLNRGMSFPPFTLGDVYGTRTTFARLSAEKKLTAVVFWAMWNEQSLEELKRLQNAYEQYQPDGFQVVAINIDDHPVSGNQLEKISNYCKQAGITFSVLIDQNLETFQEYSIIAIPTTYLVSRERTIIYKLPGYSIAGAEQLFSNIKSIMKTSPGKVQTGKTKIRTPDGIAFRYFQMAKVLQKKGDHDSAVNALHKSINIDPDFLDAYNLLGILLREQGKHNDAVELYSRALRRNPDDIALMALYGNFLLAADREEGLKLIRKAIETDPDYAEAHYYLGSYFFKIGEKEDALKEASTAVNLYPLDSNVYCLLGNIYQSMGKKKLSLAAYKKAVKLFDKNGLIMDFPYLSLISDP